MNATTTHFSNLYFLISLALPLARAPFATDVPPFLNEERSFAPGVVRLASRRQARGRTIRRFAEWDER